MKNPNGFVLDKDLEYFKNHGVDVMAYNDIYPEGRQTGLIMIMHGKRVATCGEVRLEQTPGQWQPLPKPGKRTVDFKNNSVSHTSHYPDMERHLTSYNPMLYPDVEIDYTVTIKGEGGSIIVTVNTDKPIDDKIAGKLCYNLELFPGELFGKPWIMDDKQGIFPRQPNGPTLEVKSNYPLTETLKPDTSGPITNPAVYTKGFKADREFLAGEGTGYSPMVADDIIALPYAVGKKFTVRPDDKYSRFTIETNGNDLKLYDGRMNHNNGWFVVSEELPTGKTGELLRWVITPNIVEDWLHTPVVQTSQVGYHPDQSKVAVIELDSRDEKRCDIVLYAITPDGEKELKREKGEEWGKYLRYNYLRLDFSDIKTEGLYKIVYDKSESSVFRIAPDIYDRGVWQPVLEYFLPVQMCHMRVNEKYKVWHGLCHTDDATMAPTNFNHFDSYVQGPSTLCKYKPGDKVPGLNRGGWHDAGDFDLRIESQATETYILSLAYENFGIYYDATTIDQEKQLTEIHQPDGKNDILQQIEHGAITVVNGYKALGRFYRGIICKNMRQYVMLGDPANMSGSKDGDERWVFTEDNAPTELTTAAQLAATYRALRDFNPSLAEDALRIAKEVWDITDLDSFIENLTFDHRPVPYMLSSKIQAAVELLITTGDKKYEDYLASKKDFITENINYTGWIVAKARDYIKNEELKTAIFNALSEYKKVYDSYASENPYSVPYHPYKFGAGWDIQGMGFQYYFLQKHYPEIYGPEFLHNALSFILGCHPGSYTASFASGVGAVSATAAYGFNRSEFSYIPGGVISGTALILPDFPELLNWPYLWQQTEYVLGGGSSNYMFLVLAAKQTLEK
ncbi:MAG: glycoside hydrolase family 9 protein [Clostridia bacterium]|nr:glycoside hydrolase family 9 protein [Clostridia bacterium]